MKKGISLIVLVITIIVMIILAAAVVIAMSNNGIIDRAGQAVQLTDEKQVQDLAALAWAEAYLDEIKRADIVNVVKEELERQGVTEDKWEINVSETGVVVTSKNNASVETVTFTFLDTEYTVAKGTTWYNFIWNGEGKNLDFFYASIKENTTGNVFYGAGTKIKNASTNAFANYEDEILEATYVRDDSGFTGQ